MLNFSSFMHLTYEYRKIRDTEICNFIIFWLTELIGIECPDSIMNTIYEPTTISKFYKGQRELTKEIIDRLGEDPEKYYDVFRKRLIPSLSETLIDDYSEKIYNLINCDETILKRQKNKFNESYSNDELAIFLTKVFLYAIRKENVLWKETPDKDEIEYVIETDRRCAKCGKNIFKTRKGKTFYKYSIVNIYPLLLPATIEQSLDNIKPKPIDAESKHNKICLCADCANEYETTPTTRTYDLLVQKKCEILKKISINERIDCLSLDQEIMTVILSLKRIDSPSELTKLRTKPLEIKEKIDGNDVLRNRIIDDVVKYYHYVRKNISQIDGTDTEFKIIANSINSCYLKLKQEGLEQEEIYYKIIDWILDKMELSDSYRTACQIVVSFFVQNCEVFDEITK